MQDVVQVSPATGRFEFQKWPVYQGALEFAGLAYSLCAELPKDSATGIRDQLRRASHSIALNIAEGSSRYSVRDKTQFFRVARGSVFECVAVIDLVRKLNLVQSDLEKHYVQLTSLGKMLSGLIGYIEKRAERIKD